MASLGLALKPLLRAMGGGLQYYFSRNYLRILFALLPLCMWAFHATQVVHWSWLQRFEYTLYDMRLRSIAKQQVDDRIVIVDIDERSLSQFGRWPWSRDLLTDLVSKIFERQRAAILGIDMVFAEEQNGSGRGSTVLHGGDGAVTGRSSKTEFLMDSRQSRMDKNFAQVINRYQVVLGYYFNRQEQAIATGQLPQALDIPQADNFSLNRLHKWTGYGANIPVLANASPSGFFNVIPDDDGIIRRLPLVAVYENKVYESLALSVFRKIMGSPSVEFLSKGAVEPNAYTAQGLPLQRLVSLLLRQMDSTVSIPVSVNGTLPLLYRDPGSGQLSEGRSFRYISAGQVLSDALPANSFAGKIVLLGSSAPGIMDLRATPFSSIAPGVETHATALSTLLDSEFLHIPDYSQALEWLTVIGISLFFAFVLPLFGAGLSIVVAVGLLAAYVVLSFVAMRGGMVLPVGSILFMGSASFFASMGMGYFLETRSRAALGTLLSSYVPPELVPRMMRYTHKYHQKAVNKEMTVMFCDLRSFTRLSVHLEPDVLQKLLSEIFDLLADIIRQHGGTIDKYIGDCIMAFWGAPNADPKHAENATQTALELLEALQRYRPSSAIRERAPKNFQFDIAADIGLSTGIMAVGDVGSQYRRNYTVMGEAVNLGARLEELAHDLGANILASEQTRARAPGFAWKDMGSLPIRGVQHPVKVYALG